MDKDNDAKFMEKLRATFNIEAQEHINAIINTLVQIEKNKDKTINPKLVEKIYRETHSLKGASRAVEREDIQSLCQVMEDLFAVCKQKELAIPLEACSTLYSCIDTIQDLLKGNNAENTIAKLSESLETHISNLNQEEVLASKEEEISPDEIEKRTKIEEAKSVSRIEKDNSEKTLKKKVEKIESVKSPSEDLTIRVSVAKLDRLFSQVEEMLNLKLTSRQLGLDLRNIRQKLNEGHKQYSRYKPEMEYLRKEIEKRSDPLSIASRKLLEVAEWQIQFMDLILSDFNRLLNSRLHEQRFINSTIDSTIDETKKVLMQPFSTLVEGFPRMMRDLSKELQKNVNFECIGGDIEVDKRILEEMKDPLIHLIRNSVDHGIEKPEERQKKGKLEQGNIKLTAERMSGSSMEIILSDDGRGIDVEAVKAAALHSKQISEKDAERLNENEALMLIFRSGVSTSPIITELSGRGLGLGIVSEKVDKMGGQLFVETKKNGGTTFRIVLPLTLATFRGIHVRSNDRDFIIPTHSVQRVVRIVKDQVKMIENQESLLLDGKFISFVHLSDLLSLPTPDVKINSGTIALLIKATEKIIAIGVDQVIEEQDILVKNLGSQLIRIRNVMGATITEWGKVIPILSPSDLVTTAIKLSIPARVKEDDTHEVKARILFAEDSITSRVLIKNILDLAGYEVLTAIDGAEALEIFKREKIDLILSDVDMPNVDGFALTERIRMMDKGKDLPIVLCTSRETKEDREHGIDVGANAYMEKSTFNQANLLNVIRKLL